MRDDYPVTGNFKLSGCVSTPATESSISNECLQIRQHEFEVCTAYLINSTTASLVPYYKFGRSANAARSTAARNRLESRYFGQARQRIETRVGSWPKGETKVGLPRIYILSVSVDLTHNRATIVTRENWEVTTARGRTVYTEVNRLHHTSMRRVKGLLLHKWVVTAIH